MAHEIVLRTSGYFKDVQNPNITTSKFGVFSGTNNLLGFRTATELLTDLNITAAYITDFSEAVDDRVNSLLVQGSNISLSYNDGSNTLTISATGLLDGAGVANQAAYWADSNTLTGTTTYIFDGSNLIVGTSSAAANTRFTTRGSGTGNSTFGYTHQNSSGTGVFQIADDGTTTIGNAGIVINSTAISKAGGFNLASTAFNIITTDSSVTGGSGGYTFNLTRSLNSNSGSTPFGVISITPTLTNSGGSTAISRGIIINPTLSTIVEFRSIELSVDSSSAWGIYQGGTNTKNYFAGKVSIGTLSSVEAFRVNGSVRIDLGSDAAGDIFYRSGDVFTRLPIGGTGQVLTVAAGLPSWATPTVGTVTSVAVSDTTDIDLSITQASPAPSISGVLTTTGVSANTYGSASAIPVFAVDSKGRITGVTGTTIAIAASQVTSGTFANGLIAVGNVTQHQASLTILETQITDGALLARVGGTETITGLWTFTGNVTIPLVPVNAAHAASKQYVDNQITGSTVIAGDGLTKSGNTLHVVTANSGRIVVNPDTIDLASGIVSANTYGSASTVPVFSADTYGRVTGVTGTTIAIAASQVTSGTFANALIAVGNVTQHQASLTILESQITDGTLLARVGGTETITGLWTFTGNVTVPLVPVDAAHAASKQYVDNIASGLDWKNSVRLASTASVTVTYNSTGGTSATGQITNAPNTLDSVSLAANDRILLKDQSSGAQNGIWVVTTLGTGANGVWDRATDFDSNAEVTAGAAAFVTEGTTNGDSAWVLTTNDPITIGTGSGTALSFSQFSGAGQITAGDGLTKSGNTLHVVTANSGRIVVNPDTIDLASGIVTANTYGSASTVPVFSADTYGRVTGVTGTPIAIAASQVTSGTFANGLIAVGNVTQHQASLTILESQITDGTILARVGSSETITGLWTFTGNVTIPLVPTVDAHAASKQYVDNQITGSTVIAGDGLTKSGNTLHVVTANSGRIVVNPDTIDLASGIVSANTYGSASTVPVFSADTYGRVTGVTGTTISITSSNVSNFTSAVQAQIGNGVANKIAYWSGTTGLTYNTNLSYNTTGIGVGPGATNPIAYLYVNNNSNSSLTTGLEIDNTITGTTDGDLYGINTYIADSRTTAGNTSSINGIYANVGTYNSNSWTVGLAADVYGGNAATTTHSVIAGVWTQAIAGNFGSVSNGLYGGYLTAVNNNKNSPKTLTNSYGVYASSYTTHVNATTTNSIGVYARATNSDTGTTTNGEGVRIEQPWHQTGGTGIMTNSYGLKIVDTGNSQATNRWAIYSDSNNKSYLLGSLGIGSGSSTPAQTLHVQGTARITGSDGTPTTIMGRDADGDISAITVGTGLQLTGTTLFATGGGTLSGDGDANKIAFWSGTTGLTYSSIFSMTNDGIQIGDSTPSITSTSAYLNISDAGNNTTNKPAIEVVVESYGTSTNNVSGIYCYSGNFRDTPTTNSVHYAFRAQTQGGQGIQETGSYQGLTNISATTSTNFTRVYGIKTWVNATVFSGITEAAYGADTFVNINSSNVRTVPLAIGSRGSAYTTNANSTITLGVGIQGTIRSTAGTMTTAAAIQAVQPSKSAGTMTTSYAVHITDTNTSDATNRWALYSDSNNKSYLLGSLGIGSGSSTPAQTLHVQGTARITGSDGTPTTIMGRDGDGDISAITVGSGLQLTGTTLFATGGAGATVTKVYIEGFTGTTLDLDNDSAVKDFSGTTVTFTLPSNLDALDVFKNGILLSRSGGAITRDYSVNVGTNTLTFEVSLATNDNLVIKKTT